MTDTPTPETPELDGRLVGALATLCGEYGRAGVLKALGIERHARLNPTSDLAIAAERVADRLDQLVPLLDLIPRVAVILEDELALDEAQAAADG